MKFSLITVMTQTGNEVAGHWVQNHIGTLESATAAARRTEAANGHRVDVAVVDELTSVTPLLSSPHWFLARLDKGRLR